MTDATSGNTNGTATLTATGGTAPYSFYQGTTASYTAAYSPVTLLNLSSGFHDILIKDAHDCEVQTKVGISDANGPVFSSETLVEPKCSYSSDGSIIETYTGNAPLVYEWEDGKMGNSISGLAKGKYYLTITDNLGLITTRTVNLLAPGELKSVFYSTPSPCAGYSRTCSDQKAVAWALARVTNICEASGRVDANAFENIQNIF